MTGQVLAAAVGTGTGEAVTFWILAPLALGCAIAMVFSRHAVHAALTAQVLATTDSSLRAEERVAAWESDDEAVVTRATATLIEITSEDTSDLARMSVGLRVVRALLAAP